jgi:hypothetical protein
MEFKLIRLEGKYYFSPFQMWSCKKVLSILGFLMKSNYYVERMNESG